MDQYKAKICHVATVDITIKFLLMSQLKFLMDQGYQVHVVCSPGTLMEDIWQEGIIVKGIEIKRKISPFSDIITLLRLFFYFKKEKFDVVHTHSPKPGLLGQLAARMAGVPVIIDTVHGLYVTKDSSLFKRIFFISLKKLAAQCSTIIFSQNREDIATMVRERIAKPEKIIYLGNGIDIAKFNAENFSRSFIEDKKKELGLPTNGNIIGTVGRLVKEKGYLELFEAMKIVLKQYPESMLLVIGPEEPEKKDRFSPRIVKEYGIEKNVLFLGERRDIEELYPLMDIFVLASHREGFPRSVIEAMAMQRPIVVTNIRGCREEIDDRVNGMMVPPKDSHRLADAIIVLLENQKLSQEFAKNARIKAIKEFDEKLVFEIIKKEYARLLEKKIKICHVTTVDITIRFILWDILRFLKKENYNVSVACSPGKWVPFIRKEGFPVYTVTMTRRITPLQDLAALAKLFLYFKKEKFSIVHTSTPKAGVIGRIAARLAGVPVVIHSSHGFYIGVQMDRWARRVIMIMEKIASYFCDIIISQNQEDIDFVMKKKVINPKKIKLLKYGIDVERFNASHFSQDFILRKKRIFGIEDKKIIGMVGRFLEEKGYLNLFEAFQLVKSKIPDAVLLLVAPKDSGKVDTLDKSIIHKYGIENDVILFGYESEITDMETIYPLMDVFVLPSFREGFPYSIMEASASGRPIVATDIRGCREAVEDGTTGILVPLNDYKTLAEALIYLLNNPQKAKEMGYNGRKKAEKEFDENIMFIKIKEEYERLIHQAY